MHKILAKLTLSFCALVLLGLTASSVRADVIYISPQQVHPAGVGTVATVLSIQSPGNSTNEVGSVGWNGHSDFTTGDALRGGTNSTYTAAQLGLTNPQSLQINFTINEPHGPNPGVSTVLVNSITLTAYNSATGAATVIGVYNPATDGSPDPSHPGLFTLDNCGQGCSEYLFGLDAASAARLQAALAADPNLRLGLAANISSATGGPEHFFFGVGNQPAQVPEPATMILFGSGLAGMAAAARKRRKANKASSE